MNTHETGILRGLIQAFLAISKGSASAPKTSTTTPSEAVLGLVVQVASEILTKIESMESGSNASGGTNNSISTAVHSA